MKKVILILMLAIGTFFGVKGQTTPGSGSINDILIAFDSEGKTGELYFDKDTQLFQGGWISYSIPNGGGLYYMLPVNSVSGQLVGSISGPIQENLEFPLPGQPLPTELALETSTFSHFEGTIYYGQGSEWGNLVLNNWNNGVLTAVN
ncbi:MULTISPECIES: hypothetical protein [Sphingobacterium]|jgi:hypothetical protein|uniref:Uncharacterized protein n=2 Tax=Sphingobacterium TaxID=28453 RepID=A0A562M951_9SPHI|nr:MULTISPECIES: hypothetical protein [Sphingobacterium]HAF33395.1 hypothetical protein [Sphingobacterium sp.]TWI16469.1 hypothetical protein IQ31_04313 [Sphingobacterium siyangense]HAL51197.1 hypothetical protein [Sphingobacterium sp.]HAT93197.1 hypothetical protein [Sphingobacterium sp.]HAU55828.1 hypothetical protein [Sphingobacterium sp.]